MRGWSRRSARWPAALKARGLEHGDRVASWLPKNRLTSLLPLACARAGLIHVPINPLLKRLQVAHILADSGASLLITAQARAATLEPGDVACPVLDEAESEALFGIPIRSARRTTIRTSWRPCSTPRARPGGPRA